MSIHVAIASSQLIAGRFAGPIAEGGVGFLSGVSDIFITRLNYTIMNNRCLPGKNRRKRGKLNRPTKPEPALPSFASAPPRPWQRSVSGRTIPIDHDSWPVEKGCHCRLASRRKLSSSGKQLSKRTTPYATSGSGGNAGRAQEPYRAARRTIRRSAFGHHPFPPWRERVIARRRRTNKPADWRKHQDANPRHRVACVVNYRFDRAPLCKDASSLPTPRACVRKENEHEGKDAKA